MLLSIIREPLLELIGTHVLGLTEPFVSSGSQSFTQFHINHPEVFFMLTRGFLIR